MNSTRIVPNFFVLGVQKAGTTFLCHHLASHDKIQFSKRKETFFFGKKGINRKDYENYLARFFPERLAKPGATVAAEGSATYFQSRHARKNMRRLLGSDHKVMVSLRDPVTKMISWYMHNYIRGQFDRSHPILDRALIKRARYATHLARWQKAMGPERLRVVTYDLLKEDPLKFVNTALEHLKLDPLTTLASTPVNAGFRIVQRGDYLEPIFEGSETRNLPPPRFAMRDISDLHIMLRHDTERTQELTGLDLSKWLAPPVFKRVDEAESVDA